MQTFSNMADMSILISSSLCFGQKNYLEAARKHKNKVDANNPDFFANNPDKNASLFMTVTVFVYFRRGTIVWGLFSRWCEIYFQCMLSTTQIN